MSEIIVCLSEFGNGYNQFEKVSRRYFQTGDISSNNDAVKPLSSEFNHLIIGDIPNFESEVAVEIVRRMIY